jgi:hypothetical protein
MALLMLRSWQAANTFSRFYACGESAQDALGAPVPHEQTRGWGESVLEGGDATGC